MGLAVIYCKNCKINFRLEAGTIEKFSMKSAFCPVCGNKIDFTKYEHIEALMTEQNQSNDHQQGDVNAPIARGRSSPNQSLVKMCYEIGCEYLDKSGRCQYDGKECPYVCRLIHAQKSQNQSLTQEKKRINIIDLCIKCGNPAGEKCPNDCEQWFCFTCLEFHDCKDHMQEEEK